MEALLLLLLLLLLLAQPSQMVQHAEAAEALVEAVQRTLQTHASRPPMSAKGISRPLTRPSHTP